MNDTYTCATEGCGEPIYWSTYTPVARWRHERSDNLTCNVREIHYAHPAGGTNTTPPEELERDVKKVTMAGLKEIWEDSDDTWGYLRDSIQSYADQAVEEATAELRTRLDTAHKDVENYVEELADLREQLDRALVPKFKVGDTVLHTEDGDEVMITEPPVICYSVEDSLVFEEHLAPLETETPKCQHEGNAWKVNEHGFWIGRPARFCSSCGESLTKETP